MAKKKKKEEPTPLKVGDWAIITKEYGERFSVDDGGHPFVGKTFRVTKITETVVYGEGGTWGKYARIKTGCFPIECVAHTLPPDLPSDDPFLHKVRVPLILKSPPTLTKPMPEPIADDPYYIVIQFDSKSEALYSLNLITEDYEEFEGTVMRGGLVLCDKDFSYSKEVINDPDK